MVLSSSYWNVYISVKEWFDHQYFFHHVAAQLKSGFCCQMLSDFWHLHSLGIDKTSFKANINDFLLLLLLGITGTQSCEYICEVTQRTEALVVVSVDAWTDCCILNCPCILLPPVCPSLNMNQAECRMNRICSYVHMFSLRWHLWGEIVLSFFPRVSHFDKQAREKWSLAQLPSFFLFFLLFFANYYFQYISSCALQCTSTFYLEYVHQPCFCDELHVINR